MHPFSLFILLSGIASHLLMAWLLIRALLTHRRHVAHHRFSLRPLGRDEASAMMISRALTKERESLTPAGDRRSPLLEGERAEEALEAVTSGQRLLGVLFVLGFAAFILFCLSDPTP